MWRMVGNRMDSRLFVIAIMIAVLLVLPINANASQRFQFKAKEVGFRPVSNWQFLRSEQNRIEEPICRYAEKIDDPCLLEAHPPCEKLVPIALTFCSGDIVRAMQPRVLSKAESIFWHRKYSHCVYEATRALITNPLRKEEYCPAAIKKDK